MILRLKLSVTTFQKLSFCTQNKNKLYSHTIFLPKTKFPLRLENNKLAERDKNISNVAEFDELYKWQRGHLSEPEFVLHDGPPYANGKLHMGHAINKILKDVILRFQLLKGNKVHYIPGWDCHGLPIELKALSKKDSPALDIRSNAKQFAKITIEDQQQEFKSWGIVGDWHNHYATYHSNYVKIQLKMFNKLFKKKLIYRDFKPIYWSPSTRTALAEAELEYNEKHVSPSTFVRFKITKSKFDTNGLYALIWTTTPWTLPSNQAVCFNPNLQYSLIKNEKDNHTYIIASDLVESVSKTLQTNLQRIETFSGEALANCSYQHPIYKDQERSFLPGSHATASKGTGLVHTAPAHGSDDFLIGLQHKLCIVDLVNDLGCYKAEAGSELEGKFVLKEGNEKVLQMLNENVLHVEDFIHSYPYDWRTKQPVIIRASQQWFIDTNSIKNKAIEVLENVQIYPKINSQIYKKNLINQVQKRPYWCISRQRKWGVPIPVFINKLDQSVLLNDEIIRHFYELIDKHGPDFWWKLPVDQLIPSGLHHELKLENFAKSEDILDIWFDSGISWATALEGDKIADLYLEGVDQFNGWFQSSLLTSVALRDKAPFKAIYVHGFAVDASGAKMSKSLGNVTSPGDIIGGAKGKKAYGLDALRWWVACHANRDSIAHVTPNVFQSSVEELQKVRGTLRFVLGALADYNPAKVDAVRDLSVLDRYILHLLYKFYEQTLENVDLYEFHRISASVINLLTNQISAVYFTAIKDRLYCDSLSEPRRQASLFVLARIFDVVTFAIAPIVPHLVEEMYCCLPQKSGKSYFSSAHQKPEKYWFDEKIEKLGVFILDVKRELNRQVGANTLGWVVHLNVPHGFGIASKEYGDLKGELVDIFQVSEVILHEQDLKAGDFSLKVTKSDKFACPRCRRVQATSGEDLCIRCNEVVLLFNSKTAVKN